MYKAVAQSFSLYGSESWVLTWGTIKALTTFHHQAARRIMGMTAKRGAGGERYYSAVEEEMDYAGIQPIGVYQKSAYNYSGDVGLPACLRTVHGGGEDSGYEPDGAMVGSRRGK